MAASNGKNSSKKLCKEDDVNKKMEQSLTPRSYQIEILETAQKGNTIACLGTGTGKTFIAVMLIRNCANDVRLPFDSGGKRIFFLVPTVPLVHQQSKTIKDHTDLNVKGFFGDMNVDSWSHEKWNREFEESEVLVMTAEIFRIIVDHSFIPLNKIKLIIFDECHRAQGDHPYSQAMKRFIHLSTEEMPKIFGLSASLINGKCKPTQLEKQLNELEKTLRCSITTASDIIDLQKYGADPDECIVCYKPYVIESNLFSEIHDLRQTIENQQSSLGRGNDMIEESELVFFDKPLRCLNSLEKTLQHLGPWCAAKAGEVFLEELSIVMKKAAILKPSLRLTLVKLISFLEYFTFQCKKMDFKFERDNLEMWPSKLRRLLEIFEAIRKSKKFMKEPAPTGEIKFHEYPEDYFQLLKAKECENDLEIQICAIVFVEQRVTAYVLCEWILEVVRQFPEFKFLMPEYIVGHGSSGMKKTSMSERRQKNVLTDFRSKKCSVLISTCVLEEGMDVQQCNIVIRFDLPFDFRAYVQSKGRARSKNSIYVLMSEIGEKHARFCLDMCNFKTVEQMLLDKCHNRSTPSDEEIREFMDDSLIPPYMPYGQDGPCITLISAISLINRYCANLPSDMATKLTAKWTIKESDPDDPEKLYECTLRMPINSPLRAPIVGEKMRRKRLAKMAAALKACKMLDEYGELNEHLVPYSSLLEKKIEEEIGPMEEEDGNGAIPGTKRRRQPYNKHVPIFVQNSQPLPLSPSYLHVLKMDLVEPLPKELNPRNRPIIDPAASSRSLGILLSKRLPEVNSFPLFTKVGKMVIKVSVCKNVFILSEKELQTIKKFHKFMFSDALVLDRDKTFDPDSSEMPYYVVPINSDHKTSWTIDFSFMNEVFNHQFNKIKKMTFQTMDRTVYDKNLYRDAVLLKSYKVDLWKEVKPEFHHVIDISDKTPSSTWEYNDKFVSFKEYYKAKYNISIQNDQQFLVETCTNQAKVNWKPLYVNVKEVFEDCTNLSRSKKKHKEYQEFLIPELSIIHPFPSPFFLKVQYLPTILFRLHSLLLAEELRQSVAKCDLVGTVELPKGFHWPYFSLETSDKELKNYLYKMNILKPGPIENFVPQDIKKSSKNQIISFSKEVDLNMHVGPNPSLLLQAMTAKSAGDEFDLERLEMIGDSFLKFVMSVKTYIAYPTFDEGKLTKIRSSIIQNLHLYQLAKKKKLPEFFICTGFSCYTTWLPPCYVVDEHVDKVDNSKRDKLENDKAKTIRHYFTKQVISDKSVADAVEALIGAYLLSCGQRGALMFMSWLGLNPLPHKRDNEATRQDFMTWPPEPPSVIVGQVSNVEDFINFHTDGFHRFEKTINYTFKDRALLLQAFTHPSYQPNEVTDCYQRLEFLGDAVLDFLITRQLYEDPKGHTPGKLTDLRSALVNNIYFACLAVKYEYHKYLKMLSAPLFGLMNHFLEVFQNSEYFMYFKRHGYCLEEIECFELDEVEVPKALGDLFESVAGAIYLDSGRSLDTVWKVYYPMIAPAIDHLTEHVPISPVRELYECLNRKGIFDDVTEKGERTYVKVILPDGKEIVGSGPNKKVAKRSAAKRALAWLKPIPCEPELIDLVENDMEIDS